MLTIKFCGLQTENDIKIAVELGVNAIGLVFYPSSPRNLELDTAIALSKKIPAFTTIVALVVNMPEQDLVALSHQVAFDVVQFHGDESAHECGLMAQRVCKRWIKAIRVKPNDDSESILHQIQESAHFGASGVILDAFSDTAYGGTGHSFDWTKIPDNSPLPIYLAGGLTPDTIGEIVNNKDLMAKIAGVDVSGGIEKEKGVKCGEKMADFIKNLKIND